LINQDKVALIIRAGTSNETIPASQVAEKYGIPHVNAIPQQESLTNGSLKWTLVDHADRQRLCHRHFRALDMTARSIPS